MFFNLRPFVIKNNLAEQVQSPGKAVTKFIEETKGPRLTSKTWSVVLAVLTLIQDSPG